MVARHEAHHDMPVPRRHAGVAVTCVYTLYKVCNNSKEERIHS
jgi:hypothetical protein